MSEWNAATTTKLLKLVAEQGPPGKREVAKDVLAGRHTLRDLAYLPGEMSPGMGSLLERWNRTNEQERAAIVAGSDEAMRRIADAIDAAEVAEPGPPPRQPARRRPADDEEEYFANNDWFIDGIN
jgi:hypothetical protein